MADTGARLAELRSLRDSVRGVSEDPSLSPEEKRERLDPMEIKGYDLLKALRASTHTEEELAEAIDLDGQILAFVMYTRFACGGGYVNPNTSQ